MNSNKHHPEYWVMRDEDGIKPIDMPDIYIAEMILDWTAMGMNFKNSNPYIWFNKKRNYYSNIMTTHTFNKVEKIVTEIWGNY